MQADGNSPAHMAALYNVCVSQKVWKTFPNGSHNDTYAEDGYFDSMYEFICKVLKGKNVNEIKDDEKAAVLDDKANL